MSKHYLVRKRFSTEEAASALNWLASTLPEEGPPKDPVDPEAMKRLVQNLVSFMEQVDAEVAASFGVSIIWVDDFKELPGMLAQVYSGKSPEPAASASPRVR